MLLNNKMRLYMAAVVQLVGQLQRHLHVRSKSICNRRSAVSLDKVVDEIVSLGGNAVAATVNAMDQKK